MTRSIGGLFCEHQRALEAIARIFEAGSSLESITLLMSDRTMQRTFSLRSRLTSELPVPMDPAARKLAAGLRPLAPLGAPGAGTVGVGPAILTLERAGLGSAHGIRDALLKCGVPKETVELVSKTLPNGAILVFVQADEIGELGAVRAAFDDAKAQCDLEGDGASLPAGGIWRPLAVAPGAHASHLYASR